MGPRAAGAGDQPTLLGGCAASQLKRAQNRLVPPTLASTERLPEGVGKGHNFSLAFPQAPREPAPLCNTQPCFFRRQQPEELAAAARRSRSPATRALRQRVEPRDPSTRGRARTGATTAPGVRTRSPAISLQPVTAWTNVCRRVNGSGRGRSCRCPQRDGLRRGVRAEVSPLSARSFCGRLAACSPSKKSAAVQRRLGFCREEAAQPCQLPVSAASLGTGLTGARTELWG